MHVLVTLLIILLSFLYDNLSKFTYAQWWFNKYVWFLLCLLIKLPFHTLTCEHQIIHIFMSYLEAWLHLIFELLQKIWSASDRKVINMQATHTNGLPSFRVTAMHSIHEMFQQCDKTTSGVSCGTDARYVRSTGRKIDTRTSASSSSDIRVI